MNNKVFPFKNFRLLFHNFLQDSCCSYKIISIVCLLSMQFLHAWGKIYLNAFNVEREEIVKINTLHTIFDSEKFWFLDRVITFFKNFSQMFHEHPSSVILYPTLSLFNYLKGFLSLRIFMNKTHYEFKWSALWKGFSTINVNLNVLVS